MLRHLQNLRRRGIAGSHQAVLLTVGIGGGVIWVLMLEDLDEWKKLGEWKCVHESESEGY